MIETIERPAAEISRIPPGHFRCKWQRIPGLTYVAPMQVLAAMMPGTLVIDENTWISPPRFISRERADEDGRKWTTPVIRYVEAVYFPGEAP